VTTTSSGTLALGSLLAAALAVWLLTLWQPWLTADQAAAAGAAMLLPAAGLWWLARAGQRGGLALAALAALVVLASDLTLRPGETSGGGPDLQSLVKLLLWVGGGLLVLWNATALRRACAHLPSAALGAYGVWCLVGTVYSATPVTTLAASLAFLGVWVLATVTAQALSERQGLWILATALLGALALSLLVYLVAPERALAVLDNGRSLRLAGLFGSPNTLARAAALAALCVLLLLPGLPRGRAVLLLALAGGLCGTCLWLAGGRGSVAALLLALAVAGLGRRPGWTLAALLLGALGAALLMVLPEAAEAAQALLSRSGRSSEITTLTGRTEIWAAVLGLVEQAPQFGHGFASTREVLPAYWSDPFGWTTSSAHNLWLQALVTTGIVGLALLLAAQAGWLWCFVQRRAPVRDAVIVFVLAVGVLEASAAGPTVNLLTYAWAWAAALGLRQPAAPEARRDA
jgi:O-antigen ligase